MSNFSLNLSGKALASVFSNPKNSIEDCTRFLLITSKLVADNTLFLNYNDVIMSLKETLDKEVKEHPKSFTREDLAKSNWTFSLARTFNASETQKVDKNDIFETNSSSIAALSLNTVAWSNGVMESLDDVAKLNNKFFENENGGAIVDDLRDLVKAQIYSLNQKTEFYKKNSDAALINYDFKEVASVKELTKNVVCFAPVEFMVGHLESPGGISTNLAVKEVFVQTFSEKLNPLNRELKSNLGTFILEPQFAGKVILNEMKQRLVNATYYANLYQRQRNLSLFEIADVARKLSEDFNPAKSLEELKGMVPNAPSVKV